MTPVPEIPRQRRTLHLILPKEHGGWSLALEPLALGLVAAPSAAGATLGAAVLAGFFLRRPAKMLLSGAGDERRPAALRAVVGLGVLAVAGLAVAAALAAPSRLWPLLPAALAGAIFVWFDSRNAGRGAAAELTGVVAFAFVPAALAAAAGWAPVPALALAAVMAGRSVPTVMTIRVYLRRLKGEPVSRLPAVVASFAALAGFVVLVRAGLAPKVTVWAGALLVARTLVLLAPAALRLKANTVGLAEAGFGGILVLVLALSWSR
jgi:YwiC-like protein